MRIPAIIRRLTATYVAPRTCPVCGRLLHDSEEALCLVCHASIEPLRHIDTHPVFTNAALSNAIAPQGILEAWISYDPRLPQAEIIRSTKYYGTPQNGRIFGRYFARDLLTRNYKNRLLGIGDIDVLLPMPMHFTKELQRGYNQSRQIASGIADVLDIPVADNLVAVRPHSTQTHLGSTQRHRNIAGCFALRHPEELQGLNIALVDDIITTGASMAEAATAISHAGAKVTTISLLALGLTVLRK